METETPVITEPKASKSPALTILIVLFALASIGLGVWGKMTNDKVIAALSAKSELEAKYNSLLTENTAALTDFEAASAELNTAKGDLEKVKKELTTSQNSLTKAVDNAGKLQSDIDKASLYVAVLSGFLVEKETLSENLSRIKATEDAVLQEKHDTYYRTGSETDALAFVEHILKAIASLLK